MSKKRENRGPLKRYQWFKKSRGVWRKKKTIIDELNSLGLLDNNHTVEEGDTSILAVVKVIDNEKASTMGFSENSSDFERILPKLLPEALELVQNLKTYSRSIADRKHFNKLYNLRDLVRQLPKGWTEERGVEYYTRARRVTERIRGVNPALEAAVKDQLNKLKVSSAFKRRILVGIPVATIRTLILASSPQPSDRTTGNPSAFILIPSSLSQDISIMQIRSEGDNRPYGTFCPDRCNAMENAVNCIIFHHCSLMQDDTFSEFSIQFHQFYLLHEPYHAPSQTIFFILTFSIFIYFDFQSSMK